MSDDLAAWLTQIWDEDETVATDADGDDYYLDFGAATGRYLEHHTPGVVLARVAADRQILAMAKDVAPPYDSADQQVAHDTLTEVVRLLALPHADRPGYQEAWKP